MPCAMTRDRDEGLLDAAVRLVDRLTRKAVNFDLDTDALVEETGRRDTRRAYSAIRGVLGDLGYEHSQYSGYVSKSRRTTFMAFDDLETLSHELPWFSACCKRCHVTTVLPVAFDWLAAHSMAGEARGDEDDSGDGMAARGNSTPDDFPRDVRREDGRDDCRA